MRSSLIRFVLIVALLNFSNCLGIYKMFPQGKSENPSWLLALFAGMGGTGSTSPGAPIDLDGDWQYDGITIDEDNDGITDGVDFDNDGIVDLGLLDLDHDGAPDAVDVDRDGETDYYLCIEDGRNTIRDAPSCSGSEIVLVDDDDDGLPDGFDTDGDGVINDNPDLPSLSDIRNDITPPIVSIDIPGGTYASAQSVTITCSDNIAPGTIGYSAKHIDEADDIEFISSGRFSPPPTKSVSVGADGDGTYELKFRCRDARGNPSVQKIATYTIDGNFPAISVSQTPLSYISSSGITSTTIVWKSNRSGSYVIYRNATTCGAGMSHSSGSVTANGDITSTISASSPTFDGEGARSFTICVTATANGLTGSYTFQVTRDDTAPTLALSPGTSSKSEIVSVTANCSDNLAGCDKIAYSQKMGSSPDNPTINALSGLISSGFEYASALTPTNDAVNYYKFVARDKAGNVSTIYSQTVTIATDLPNITVNSYSTPVAAGSATVSWQSDRPGSYSIKIGNDCNGTTVSGTNVSGSVVANSSISTVISNSSLSPGENKIQICVSNLIGNLGSASRTIRKDTTPPVISIDSPSGAGPFVSGTTLSLSCTDINGSGCKEIAYSVDGSDISFDSACGITVGSLFVGTPTLADGNYTIKAASCDYAGNVSTHVTKEVFVGAPGAPTITGTTGGNAQVSIAFNTVSNATSYKVYYKSSAGITTSDSFVSGTSSPIVVTGLANGTTYYFAMTAEHTGGVSVLSGETSGVPINIPAGLYFFGSLDKHAGNLGGRSGADSICAASVPAQLPCTNVHALITITSVAPADMIRAMTTKYGYPTDQAIRGPNGTQISSNWAGLIDGNIDASLSDAGVLPSGSTWYSGSGPKGGMAVASFIGCQAATCSNWTSSGLNFPLGAFGLSDTTDGSWIGQTEGASCSNRPVDDSTILTGCGTERYVVCACVVP